MIAEASATIILSPASACPDTSTGRPLPQGDNHIWHGFPGGGRGPGLRQEEGEGATFAVSGARREQVWLRPTQGTGLDHDVAVPYQLNVVRIPTELHSIDVEIQAVGRLQIGCHVAGERPAPNCEELAKGQVRGVQLSLDMDDAVQRMSVGQVHAIVSGPPDCSRKRDRTPLLEKLEVSVVMEVSRLDLAWHAIDGRRPCFYRGICGRRWGPPGN